MGGTRVRRALPQRSRRTVGAWCFADHLGPIPDDVGPGGIGPHPHAGLHTVTWLVAGQLVHRDSLGSEQAIRPGQLNLMTAGRGVSHAEEPGDDARGGLHGIQLWVAQPDATRHGSAAFEHHVELPRVDLDGAVASVLIGTLGGAVSPARADTPLLGAELTLDPGTTVVPLDPYFEHALVVLVGAVETGGRRVVPGQLAYLGTGRDELPLTSNEESRTMLLGGVPFGSPITMWWNFVGRSHREMADAVADWNDGSGRFGETVSSMTRLPAPVPPWAAHPG